jgi:hypothetical protein
MPPPGYPAQLACFWDYGLFFPPIGEFRVRASQVALIGQRDQARSLQSGQHAPDPLGLLIVHRSGQRPGYSQDVPARAGDDLQVHPVLAHLPGASFLLEFILSEGFSAGTAFPVLEDTPERHRDPQRDRLITRAALVLTLFEHKRLT